MPNPLSTTSPGMQKSAEAMRTTKTTIEGIITKVMGEVHGMPYAAGSADKFRTAMDDWEKDAKIITKDLETMATELTRGSGIISKTEDDNASTGGFF